MSSLFTRNRFAQLSAAGALLALMTPTAVAQDLNIDVGEDLSLGTFGVPTAVYGAGAAQPGTWNGVTDGIAGFGFPADTTPWYVGTNLLSTTGAATTADCVAITNATSSGTGDFQFNNAGTTGNDQALMDDCMDMGGVGSTVAWTFNELANGVYDVYTYAWASDSGTFLTSISVPGTDSTNPQVCGGAWPGVQQQGITFTKHTVEVRAGTLTVNISTQSGFGSVNGFQLDLQAGPPISSYCFGDGTGTACPCGNTGSAGRGCKNSKPGAPFGALLTAVNNIGNPNPSVSVTVNDLGLKCENMMAGSYAIFFQGTEDLGNGNVSAAYDGLLCVSGTVVRLGRVNTMGGTNTMDGVAGVAGLAAAGQTRHYQAVYRNAVAFCTPATLNTSNALTVNWTP
jgi:hypothetical protein